MNPNLIRGRIKAKGFTQAQTAVKAGMSSNSLSRKLSGKRDFKLSEVDALCRVLDIPDPSPYFFSSKIPLTQQNKIDT